MFHRVVSARIGLVACFVLMVALSPVYSAIARMRQAVPLTSAQGAYLIQKWWVIPSPSPKPTSKLAGVTALSPIAIWAVGSSGPNNYQDQTLIERWDGRQWRVIPSPNVGNASYDYLLQVAAITPRDIWAVGRYQAAPAHPLRTLIQHWGGRRWRIVPSPSVGASAQLFGVAAIAANDVWAVGDYTKSSFGLSQTLIEHWDGRRWRILTSPSPSGSADTLVSVAAIAANDVWTVGIAGSKTLTEHWDGSSWSIVASPNQSGNGALSSVTARATNDVWAVGNYFYNGSLTYTLIEHWDGSSWSIVPSPNKGTSTTLSGVAAAASNDVWAVGSAANGLGPIYTLAEHWNGSSWQIVPSANDGTADGLTGVTFASRHAIWAVGNASSNNGQNMTLVEVLLHH